MAAAPLLEEIEGNFAATFGAAPEFIASAPGRVNLIGEHTDYNEGLVLPMAIDRHTIVAARRHAGPDLNLFSCALDSSAVLPLRPSLQKSAPFPGANPNWVNHLAGVVAGFQRLGIEIPGLELAIASNLPIGAGLSSSAALQAATATLLEAVTERTLDAMDKALLCQVAEQDFAGVPCGFMDHFTACLARADHALFIDCRTRAVEWIPLADARVTVLVCDTRVRHQLEDGQYAARRAQCENAARTLGVASLRDASLHAAEGAGFGLGALELRRARHVVNENQRVLEARAALVVSDWPRLGQLFYASHASLRDDFEVSSPELDLAVDTARAIGRAGGIYGARLTGAGFGGCAILLAERTAMPEIERRLHGAFARRGFKPPALFAVRASGPAAAITQSGSTVATGSLRDRTQSKKSPR